jgi:anti-sigma regulatory factor (Ser/Thr protein kinase)
MNVQGFLRRCEFSDPQRLHVAFHERWVSVHPTVVALTAAAARHVQSEGGEVTVDPPSPANQSLRYLATMGLFEALQCDPPEKIKPHEPAGRFIPLTQIRNSSELSSFIVDMVPLLHASKEEVEPIQYVISELVRNVIEHANSPTGATLCAQYYKASRRLALGVVDAGIGIRASLASNYPTADDLEAVMLAMRPGVTGTTPGMYGTDYNAGAGLFFTKSIACASNNRFVLYSGRGFFKLLRTPAAARTKKGILIWGDPSKDYYRGIKDLPAWQGTVAGIDIAIEKGRTFAQLLTAIRNVYGIDRKAASKRRFKEPRFV